MLLLRGKEAGSIEITIVKDLYKSSLGKMSKAEISVGVFESAKRSIRAMGASEVHRGISRSSKGTRPEAKVTYLSKVLYR